MKRAGWRGKKKHGFMDLGELYKLSSDDYIKDRKVVTDGDIDIDDEGDLSPNRGGQKGDERLPALENAVENDCQKWAIQDPCVYKNPVPPRYWQKNPEFMVKVNTPEYEIFINDMIEIAEKRKGNHYVCLYCWRFLSLSQ